MQLPRGRNDNEHGRILYTGEWPRCSTQEHTDNRRSKMLMRGRNAPCAPLVPEGLYKRTNQPLKYALPSQSDLGLGEHMLQTGRIKCPHGVKRLVQGRRFARYAFPYDLD